VLDVVAQEIGNHWGLDRCIVALRKPGLAVSILKEFVRAGGTPSAVDVIEPLLTNLHERVIASGVIACSDVSSAPELGGMISQLSAIGAQSLLVLPVGEGAGSVGVVLLVGGLHRNWPQNDVLVFKMIVEQAATALSNAGLRR